jgi:PD-(D/E)XK nuclease superfamily
MSAPTILPADATVPGTHWSNSSLMLLERCGEAFRRRYIEGERFPPSPRMLRGIVVHRVSAMAMLRKLEEHELPTLEEAKDVAATEFEQQWAGGVSLEQEPIEGSANQEKASSKDFAIGLSDLYVSRVAPRLEPIAVERFITVKPKDSDLVIRGGVDLVAKADGDGGGEAIRDTKTSEKSPRSDMAERSQQLTFYAMIRHADVGALPKQHTLDYLVQTPGRRERKHVPLHTTRDAHDVAALVHRLNTAVEAVKRGVFMPAAPDAWNCSPRWCEFYSSCVYVRRGADRPRT